MFDDGTETVINGVDQQDPQDRQSQVAEDGSLTFKLNGEDNVIVYTASVGSGMDRKAHTGLILALQRRDSGSNWDSVGPIPGPAAWRAGVSDAAEAC